MKKKKERENKSRPGSGLAGLSRAPPWVEDRCEQTVRRAKWSERITGSRESVFSSSSWSSFQVKWEDTLQRRRQEKADPCQEDRREEEEERKRLSALPSLATVLSTICTYGLGKDLHPSTET